MAAKRKATTLKAETTTPGAGAAGAAAAAAAAGAAATAMKGGGREGVRGNWMDLGVPAYELRPEFSLMMGQCFNWRRKIDQGIKKGKEVEEEKGGKEEGKVIEAPASAAVKVRKGGEGEEEGEEEEEDKVWVGVLDRYILEVQQTRTSTLVRRVVVASGGGVGIKKGEEEEEEVLLARLRDYFQVGTPLAPLYATWAHGDPRMRSVADSLPGVRVVRQDPVECLFSFICSSNNNIARIGLMLTRLRQTYGEPLGDGHYTFPSVSSLAAASEEELRGLGLGYRARFIKKTAAKLIDLGGEEWLLSLRGKGREEAQEALCAFPGVGRKVADCVALFSLDQHGAIPVDVH
ncbi:ankyrin repeat protein, partial [Nannochloropsis oceanica]